MPGKHWLAEAGCAMRIRRERIAKSGPAVRAASLRRALQLGSARSRRHPMESRLHEVKSEQGGEQRTWTPRRGDY
jgi:hypothetical protein